MANLVLGAGTIPLLFPESWIALQTATSPVVWPLYKFLFPHIVGAYFTYGNLGKWMAAIMQRTEPPDFSMVGTDRGRGFAWASMRVSWSWFKLL